MTKRTYTVQLPNGEIAKRTTARTYTHAVAVRRSYDYAMKQAASRAWERTDVSNWRYAVDRVERNDWDRWESEEFKARARAYAAEYSSAQEAILGERAARIARVEGARAEGYYDEWSVETFCGRHDLAVKARNSLLAKGPYEEAFILATFELPKK